ncbi:MAG TPA: TonB-dependent receptor [Steroidobacteraceae bacterium]|jgi:iron complex outermembrane receptor protein
MSCSLVGVVALLIASPAGAQATSPVASANQTSSQTPESSGSLAEIIVTAQHREERLVDVPISVAIQTGDQLIRTGISDTRDLTIMTPGLKVDRLGIYTQSAIRGISTEVVDPGTEANIAYYVDGVYEPSQIALTFDLVDIDHVEVDKGPQGTLFGRNATGGAIQIFTAKPSFTPSGSVTVGYGNFNAQEYKAFLTGPIVPDKLAGSVSVSYNGNDGYYRNLLQNGAEFGSLSSTTTRGKLLFTPVDGAAFLLTLQHINRQDPGGVLGQALNGNTVARVLAPGTIIAAGPYEAAWAPYAPYSHQTSTTASLKADFDLSYGTLTSITGYSTDDVNSTIEGDYTSAAIAEYMLSIPDRYYSEEIQFASKKRDKFSWIGGLFVFDGKGSWDPLHIPEAHFYSYGTQKDRSYAVFGEANYDFSDRLTGIAGVRFSKERKELDGSFGNAAGVPLVDPNTELGAKSWNSTTPRLSLRYQVTDTLNAYVTYNQGFKSGGYVVSSLFKQPYDPEKVDAYEIGLKSAQKDFTFNTAVFYYNYKDQQVTTSINVNGVPLGVVANAASSRIYGLDADITARLTDEFQVYSGLSLLSAKYASYPKATVNAPATEDPFGNPCTLCGNQAEVVDVSGHYLPRSPKWTLNISPEYTRKLPAGELDVSATVYHTAGFFFEPLNRIPQPAYTSVNARTSWTFGGTGVKVSAWGKNLTNRVIYSGTFQSQLADGIMYAPPRTYGLELQYRF